MQKYVKDRGPHKEKFEFDDLRRIAIYGNSVSSNYRPIWYGGKNPDESDYLQSRQLFINAKNLNVTGNKMEDKVYYKHTGYVGNMKKPNLSLQLIQAQKEQ